MPYEYLTIPNVLAFFGWILGGAVLLRNGWKAIVEMAQAFRAPNDEQNQRLKELEDHNVHVDSCLERDKAAIEDIKESQTIFIRAQLALLSHGLDGNNTKRMEESKQEIEEYLIKRK